MPGVVLPQGTAGASAQTLPLQMSGGQPTGQPAGTAASGAHLSAGSGGQAAQQITALIPMPKGTPLPATGTAVLVQAEGQGTSQSLSVSVQGRAQATPESMRVDAARQGSLAPLMADLASLAGSSQSSGSPSSGAASSSAPSSTAQRAIGQLLGFVIDGDGPVSPDAVRNAVEGAKGAAPSAASSSQPGSASGGPTMQTALGALVRALGMAMPASASASQPGASQPSAGQGAGQAGGQSGAPPPDNGAQPSRLSAVPMAQDGPDFSDPATLQALKTKAEASLSRLNLLQAGTGDGAAQAGARSEGGNGLRWDVPLFIGQEAALLGVAIERDGRSTKSAQEQAQTWRFRFAFASTQHGEIEGMIALHTTGLYDERPGLDIAVWADDPDVRARMDRSRLALIASLEGFGLGIDSLSLKTHDQGTGQPPPADTARHLVDIAS